MKDIEILNVAGRTTRLAASWVFLIAAALGAFAAYSLLLPWLQGAAADWLFAVSIVMLPAAAAMLLTLTVRDILRRDAERFGGSLLDTTSDAVPFRAEAAPILHSLDQALGESQVQELRAQVDLLCIMATLDRMGPDLAARLVLWGVPIRAQQAAVSAEILHRLLSAPGLEAVLIRCSLPPGSPALAHVQAHLQAITASLRLLSEQVEGRPAPPSFIETEIEAGDAMMGGMTPVDRLLVQYSQLLAAVAAMARILATGYEQYRDARFSFAPQRQRGIAQRLAEQVPLQEAMDLPRWKLN